MERVAALLVHVGADVTDTVVVAEVWGRPSIGDMDYVGGILPPEGGFPAGRGHRLAV